MCGEGSDPPEDTDNPGPAWRDSRDSQGSDGGVRRTAR